MSDLHELNKLIFDAHWQMDILQNIDVGLVVLDRDYKVEVWNSFMQNHSSKAPEDVLGKTIFDVFPELCEKWFKRKAQTVAVLKNASFTTWEQRPYLFKFPHYRPITGTASFMYQNSTIIPLADTRGEINHICLFIYDVTDTATNKMAQEEANVKLQELSRIDHLTNLFNRGYWEVRLEQEFKRFERYGQVSSLVMLDIDHFKSVNDRFGHGMGDDVIRHLSRCIKEQIRDLDIPGRYGGEEFGIVLTNTTLGGAKVISERLRVAAEEMRLFHHGTEVKFTISLGVCELNSSIESYKEWIHRADTALYESKKAGRNTVSIA